MLLACGKGTQDPPERKRLLETGAHPCVEFLLPKFDLKPQTVKLTIVLLLYLLPQKGTVLIKYSLFFLDVTKPFNSFIKDFKLSAPRLTL